MKRTACIITVIAAATGSAGADDIPSFQGLGVLPGYLMSTATAIAPDGCAVVGACPGEIADEAFRWTPAQGMIGLGDLPGGQFSSVARGVSLMGAVVVGDSATTGQHGHAFRWTEAGGMVDLGDLPGGLDVSAAHDVSADGSVVVGVGRREIYAEAFRWTPNEGMVGMGYLPGYVSSGASGVSADGTVIVGSSSNTSWCQQAFRYVEGEGMVGLGDLPGGFWPLLSVALAVSPDGSAVVGYSESTNGLEAFHWTEDQGMIGLGDFAGGYFDSCACDVTADGSVVVGYATSALGEEAFIWDQAHGLRRLQEVLESDYGLNLAGWQLQYANGISSDGRAIVGQGWNPQGVNEAWLAQIPEPVTGVMLATGAALTLGLAGRRGSIGVRPGGPPWTFDR